jgi:hypothetical protein
MFVAGMAEVTVELLVSFLSPEPLAMGTRMTGQSLRATRVTGDFTP